jgi:tight adherence protein B
MSAPLSLIVAVIAVVAVGVAVFAALPPAKAESEAATPDELFDDGGLRQTRLRIAASAVFTDALRRALHVVVGKRFERSTRGTRLAIALARADLKFKPAEWLLVLIGASAVCGILTALRFGSLIALPIGAAIGYIACRIFLKVRQGQRQKRFNEQLAPTIIAISNGLKAGYSFGQSLDYAGQNAADPMAYELTRVTREVLLGVPIGDALMRMVIRNHSEDLRLVTTAVQIHAQVGGNLAQILDSIEFTIRERVRIKGEIKTLTSQARASAWILMMLPFALAGIIAFAAPSYFDPMLTEGAGRVMLGIAGLSLLSGYAIIRKIVNVRV